MIISASRRTDIPAFYSDWLMNRIRDGYFCSVNPFNSQQTKNISLAPEDVDAFVFWSKNPEPMLSHLDELEGRGYRFILQFTLNDYSKEIEPGVPSLEYRQNTFYKWSERIGSNRVIWRYDPIIVSEGTPVEYHLEAFERLAQRLSGYSDTAVISLYDPYQRVVKRVSKVCGEVSCDESEQKRLLSFLSAAAKRFGFTLQSCCEDWEKYGIRRGACIDAIKMNSVFGLTIKDAKDSGQRSGCLCAPSVDMGMYHCCGHRCVYCYANAGDAAVFRNQKKHNQNSPRLIGEHSG